mmetsp:Transcript_10018/g.22059  ORF Transcript_10018/g.22059 Transcript_10018/m.22059 type:complete len:436 (-) Transcript_10018:235-1542(-)
MAQKVRMSDSDDEATEPTNASTSLSDTESVESDGDSSCESDEVENLPPRRLAFVAMTCVISAYTLVGPLQHDLKKQMGVSDSGALNQAFIQSVALVQWGKTFMTVGQNVLLAWLPTLHRVYLAMFVMFVGTIIPPLFIFTFESNWLGWVPIAFGCIGLGLGVFECTFLSVISPLGPLTKSWAIMGFPAAFFIVNVIWQSIRAVWDIPTVLPFWYVAACLPIGILCFRRIAPSSHKVDGKSYKQAALRSSLYEWKSWLVKMIPFIITNVAAHFTMESVLPAVFNTFNTESVSLFGPHDNHLMKTRWFLVVYCFSNAAGDMISRRLGYCFQLNTTTANYQALAFALVCILSGLYLTTLGIAAVCWIAAFLAFFGNGFLYAVTSKYIDKFVPRKHNLAAYSVWMFLGYMGAIAGAVLVSMVQHWICHDGPQAYQCHEE